MKGAKPLFSSATPSWATPDAVYRDLDAEFRFDFDPCPLNDAKIWDGKAESWAGRRVFCNPPYGRGVGDWLAKAFEAQIAVFLLPARTDTAWWHQYALGACEIRFLRGRLKFGGAKNAAPFPSVVLVYDKARRDARLMAQEEADEAEVQRGLEYAKSEIARLP